MHIIRNMKHRQMEVELLSCTFSLWISLCPEFPELKLPHSSTAISQLITEIFQLNEKIIAGKDTYREEKIIQSIKEIEEHKFY